MTIRYAGQLSMVILTKVANNCNQFTTCSFPDPKWGLWTTAHNFRTSKNLQGLRELPLKQQPASTRTANFTLCLCASVVASIRVMASPFSDSNSIWYHRFPILYMEQGDCILLYFILPPTTRFFLLTSFLWNFLLKSLLRCGRLPFFNLTSTFESIYPNIRWQGYKDLRRVWISTLLVNGFFVQRNRFCSRLVEEKSVLQYHKAECHISRTLQLISRHLITEELKKWDLLTAWIRA